MPSARIFIVVIRSPICRPFSTNVWSSREMSHGNGARNRGFRPTPSVMAPPGAFVSHRLELPRPSCSGPRSPMPPTGEGTDLAYGAARRGRSGREGAEGRRRPGWQPESPTMVKSGAVISNTRRGCTPVEPGHEEGGQMAEMMAESAQPTVPPSDDRILASGDEAGTAPGDRPFRPDVEGLRAVAVLLVVLFHSQVSAVSGGYVGVDVFFVISGFVITGVLLRERASTGRTSILSFYGRRCRRIIPAATLVIIATVGLAYWFLGVAGGIPTATDGRWAALFLANFHFISTGTNYLASQAPPSPLQNFWSLAVEEQFYVIYPTLFLLVAGARVRTLRARLAMGLIAVIIGSFVYSIVDTHGNPVDAFFSPFTRAWELALGALVAVCTPWLLKVPARAAALATWVGLGAILVAATAFSSQTAYPGYLAAIPVLGAGLIIAGGMGVHSGGAESLLRLAPFRWLGRLSYSLYLWHWPILITAAEYAGKTSLSVKDNLGWDLVALVASMLTYVVVENPVRHALSLRRNRRASIGIGIGLIAVTLGAISLLSSIAPGTGIQQGASKSSITLPAENPYVSLREVLRVVAASDRIHRLPSNLSPGVTDVLMHPGGNIGFPPAECKARSSRSSLPSCVFGDPRARRTIVLYGDSHAGMWFRAMDGIAHRSGWRLVVLFKPGCPASLVPVPEIERYEWRLGSLRPVASLRCEPNQADQAIRARHLPDIGLPAAKWNRLHGCTVEGQCGAAPCSSINARDDNNCHWQSGRTPSWRAGLPREARTRRAGVLRAPTTQLHHIQPCRAERCDRRRWTVYRCHPMAVHQGLQLRHRKRRGLSS